MKKAILSVIALITALSLAASQAIENPSVVVLYGCSSSGKTSAALALGKLLPGKWKVLGIDMFPNTEKKMANSQLWKQTNRYLQDGYNVVVDTVFQEFLVDERFRKNVYTVLMYCSPIVIAEHVAKRNASGERGQHRTLSKVFNQYCSKFRSTSNKKDSLGVVYKQDLQGRAFKQIRKMYFDEKEVAKVYLISNFASYHYFLDTGLFTILGCAQKIKDHFLKHQAEHANDV